MDVRMDCPKNYMNNTFNNIIDDITGLYIGGLCSHSLKIYDLTESPTNSFKCIHNFCISQKQNFSQFTYIAKHVSWIIPPCQLLRTRALVSVLVFFLLEWEGHSVFIIDI